MPQAAYGRAQPISNKAGVSDSNLGIFLAGEAGISRAPKSGSNISLAADGNASAAPGDDGIAGTGAGGGLWR